MAIKKSELYSSIWKSCDELRGGMDASQYKDYVLVLLFVRYVTDKYANQPYGAISIPKGGSFEDMKAAKGKTNIGERLNTIVARLASANELGGVINTADFDDSTKLGDGKEKQDRLTELIAIFENPALDFSQNRAGDDDILGDAYEYLMRNFATQSGKSKGQFYTPSEVSRVMAKIIGLDKVRSPQETIYDMTCGSGSLLLKAADEVPNNIGVTLYGQEKDSSTRALAKMNMILHGNAAANIQQGDTLANPLFLDKRGNLQRFDYAVANPPFSYKSWSNGLKPEEDKYERFVYGIPPKRNGDYAFLQHFLRSLKSTGKGAIILPHGVLFRGNMEAEIREEIVRNGFIKGIVGLPANLFYGTGIPACIIVLDKENASPERTIFMIDASKGFMKDGNKNRLRHQDIRKIVDVFNGQIELARYSRMVPFHEIEANEFNLNIPRYIDTTEPEDVQDIEAHLLGGIPNRDINDLDHYWDVFPGVADALFTPNGRDGYSELRVATDAIKDTIFQHPEFVAYSDDVGSVFEAWRDNNIPHLKGIEIDDNPKALIERISDDLLNKFADLPLVDKYDIYDHLMVYWSEVMQDDVYMLVADGWLGANRIPEMREWIDALARYELRQVELIEQLDGYLAKYGGKDGVLDKATYRGRFTEKRLTNLYKSSKGKLKGEDWEIIKGAYDTFKELSEVEGYLASGQEKLSAFLEESLIPVELLVNRYFPEEQAQIDELQAEVEAIGQEMVELEEEHGAEDGLLFEAKSDAGNLGKGSANARLREIEGEPDYSDEIEMITRWLELYDRESDLKDTIDACRQQLHEQIIRHYPTLTKDEVKTLVVEDKWLATVERDVWDELDRVSQALTNRIKQLAERYAMPLPDLQANVDAHSHSVEEHLNKMGYTW